MNNLHVTNKHAKASRQTAADGTGGAGEIRALSGLHRVIAEEIAVCCYTGD